MKHVSELTDVNFAEQTYNIAKAEIKYLYILKYL